ncbi:MAG: hypothetical protein WD055_06230 [Candidatus Dependentiae bacterium]
MKISILVCFLISIPLHAQIEIDNRSPNPVFIDKITLLNFNGIKQVAQIKEINKPLGAGQKMTEKQIIGSIQAPIVQIVIVYNNITYLFQIPATTQTGRIVITQDNRVESEGAITLNEKRGSSPLKEHMNWGVRRL